MSLRKWSGLFKWIKLQDLVQNLQCHSFMKVPEKLKGLDVSNFNHF